MSVSDETVTFVETYINLWLYLALSTFGIVINSIHLAVTLRLRNNNDSFAIQISTLCFWHLLRCLSFFIHRLYGLIELISKKHGVSWRNISGPYLDLFETSSENFTFALTAFVSLTRCLSVAKPFLVKSLLTTRFTTIMMVSISGLLFAAYFVMFFSFTVKTEFNAELNTTIFLCEYSDFYLSHGDILHKYYLSFSIILSTLALLVSSISSVITWYYLQQSAISAFSTYSRSANSQPRISQREKTVTKTLLVAFTLFICYTLPKLVFYIAQLAEPEFFIHKKYHNAYLLIFRLLMGFNLLSTCSIFFIFLIMRPNVRAQIKC